MSDDEILLVREFDTDKTESGAPSFSWGVQTFWRGQNKEVGMSVEAPARTAATWSASATREERRGCQHFL